MNMAEGPQKPSANVRMFACLQPVGTGLCRITQQLHATHRYARARFCRTAQIPPTPDLRSWREEVNQGLTNSHAARLKRLGSGGVPTRQRGAPKRPAVLG